MTEISEADLVALQRKGLPTNFYAFVRASWHVLEPAVPLVPGWHLEAVCQHLEAVSRGEIDRLAISIPPGHSKSLLTSVFWNAWVWTWAPHKRFISTSSSEDFCERDNQKLRDLIRSDWYQTRWPMTFPAIDTLLRFVNDKTGFRWAKSYHSLTGVRGNYLILDDVLHVESGNSDVERAKINRRFFESATSRLENPDGHDGIVIIMQRIHETDLIGEIKERQAKGEDLGFTFLTIPMEFEGDDNETSIGWRDPRTKIGELICPEYRSQRAVDREKVTLRAYAYAAQYQQNPVPRGNGMFKREDFNLYNPKPGSSGLPACLPTLVYYVTSDHAQGGNARGDYNVVRVWGVDAQRNLWLVDSFRERCDIQTAIGIKRINGKTVLLAKGALPFVKKYQPIAWYADQDPIIQSVEKLVFASMLETGAICEFKIIPHKNKNKEERASAFVSMSGMRMINLPDNNVGETALIEYCAFPAARHDDQIDADGLLPRVQLVSAMVTPTPVEKNFDDYVTGMTSDGPMDDSYNCF